MPPFNLDTLAHPTVSLDAASPIPLYYQLGSLLKEKILTAECRPGERLPAEGELAEAYGVSRITVRQAMASLVQEGWLRRRRGQGTFVAEKPPLKESVRLTCVLEDLDAAGVLTQLEVPEWRFIPAPPAIATNLDIPAGAEVLCYGRRLLAEAVPFSYSRGYIPAGIGRRLSREDLLTTPLLTLLDRSAGIKVERGEQAIEATLADPSMAAFLGVRAGTPLLLLQRILSTADGRAVEFRVTYHRGDRSRYILRLRRTAAGMEPAPEIEAGESEGRNDHDRLA